MGIRRLIPSIFKRRESKKKQIELKSRLDYAMSQNLDRNVKINQR